MDKEIIKMAIANHIQQAYLTNIEDIIIEDNEIEIIGKTSIHGIEYFIDVLKVFYKYYYVKARIDNKVVLYGFN